ncbi:kinase domain protein [Lineolata rhizophorae]|uniref:non-specific serine/threonine protein kinase n=1 Tax=Lineolata rhizophorae TaxID=578093 RepID=A0A6A6NNB0_9PEZI|nr:kinase domain protein [Lineolata rhizophorae]
MVKCQEPQILPPDVPVEEETIPSYNPKHFYLMSPGQIVRGRYKIVVKLRWGSTSTVWLAEDTSRWFWQAKRYVAVKFAVSNDQETENHEHNITRYLQANPSHEGFRFVRAAIDHFEITGPQGAHPCLVYDSMREIFRLFQRRVPDGKIPEPLPKLLLQHILLGLDYLHSECSIVHTDIKQDNIMLTFEDLSVLEHFLKNLAEVHMLRKMQDDSPVTLPKLADFGLAQHRNSPEPLRHPIQPPLFHAPEVILGTGWSHNADIWSLGVLIWNLLENRDLFRDVCSNQGAYDSRKYLAEMIALLGPPPEELLIERKSVFLYEDLIPSNFNLPDSILSLEGKDKELFLDFADHMLQWLPEKRTAAKDLLKHPWLTM